MKCYVASEIQNLLYLAKISNLALERNILKFEQYGNLLTQDANILRSNDISAALMYMYNYTYRSSELKPCGWDVPLSPGHAVV